MSKHPFELIVFLALAVLLVPGLVHASVIQVGGEGGTGSPPGNLCDGDEQEDEDCTVVTDYDPEWICEFIRDEIPTLQQYTDDVASLVGCMTNADQEPTTDLMTEALPGNPADGWGVEYHQLVTIPLTPPLTFEVEVEVDRLEYNESDWGIRTTQVAVDRSNLVARIAEITEGPDTVGGIRVELDDDIDEGEADDPWECVVELDAFDDNLFTALDFNVALSAALRSSNGCDLDVTIDVYEGDSFFVITRPGGFKRVQFNSSNDGIISSGIALMPEDDPELEPVLPPE